MTPEQREAALRLALLLEQAFGPRWVFVHEAVALLRELAAEPVQEPVGWLHDETGDFEPSHKPWMDDDEEWVPLYAHPPQQRKPLKTAMEAEIECDCLVAWNASTYGHSAHDTVHPMFLSAFIRGYRAAERAHGITGEQE